MMACYGCRGGCSGCRPFCVLVCMYVFFGGDLSTSEQHVLSPLSSSLRSWVRGSASPPTFLESWASPRKSEFFVLGGFLHKWAPLTSLFCLRGCSWECSSVGTHLLLFFVFPLSLLLITKQSASTTKLIISTPRTHLHLLICYAHHHKSTIRGEVSSDHKAPRRNSSIRSSASAASLPSCSTAPL